MGKWVGGWVGVGRGVGAGGRWVRGRWEGQHKREKCYTKLARKQRIIRRGGGFNRKSDQQTYHEFHIPNVKSSDKHKYFQVFGAHHTLKYILTLELASGHGKD